MDQGERAHQQLHPESLLDLSSAQHFSFMALPFNEEARPSNQLELLPSPTTHYLCSFNTFSTVNNSSNRDSFLNTWIIDSGATDHIASNLSWFISYTQISPIIVHLPNGSQTTVSYKGIVQFSPSLVLHDILYLPHFNLNIISVSKITSALICELTFSSSSCTLQSNNLGTIDLARMREGLYVFEPNFSKNSSTTHSINSIQSPPITPFNIWHFRLGHLSGQRLNHLHKQFPFISMHHDEACDICHLSKQKKLSFSQSFNKANASFDLLHFDIWGPFRQNSIHNHKYFFTIVDDFSRFTWVTLLKSKGEVQNQIKNFITLLETQFNSKVKTIRSDNGPEFILPDFYASKGIIHQRSCVETPQQNGRVERKHQHILNIARALMFQSNLPSSFWSYAVRHAVYLLNRVPSSAINFKTPFEILFNHPPNYHDLKVFGCLCFVSTQMANRSKFDPRAKKAVFIGFQHGFKGYIVYVLEDKRIEISRNVIFYEMILPLVTKNVQFHTLNPTLPNTPSQKQDSVSLPVEPSPIPIDLTPPSSLFSPTTSPSSSLSFPNQVEPMTTESLSTLETSPPSPSHPPSPSSPPEQPHPRHSNRPHRPPAYLSDYLCNSSLISTNQSPSKCKYPLSSVMSFSSLSSSHKRFLLSLHFGIVPKFFKNANQHSN